MLLRDAKDVGKPPPSSVVRQKRVRDTRSAHGRKSKKKGRELNQFIKDEKDRLWGAWEGYEIIEIFRMKKPVKFERSVRNSIVNLSGKEVRWILRQIPDGDKLTENGKRFVAVSLDSTILRAMMWGHKKFEWRCPGRPILRASHTVSLQIHSLFHLFNEWFIH